MLFTQNKKSEKLKPIIHLLSFSGRPTPLIECHVSNHTQSSIRVECKAGFDGGLPQTFLLEVYDRDNKLKTKVTNQLPIFEIANFDSSGLPVKMYVYAQNAKGSSEPFVLEETSIRVLEKSISNSAATGKRHKHAGVEGMLLTVIYYPYEFKVDINRFDLSKISYTINLV